MHQQVVAALDAHARRQLRRLAVEHRLLRAGDEQFAAQGVLREVARHLLGLSDQRHGERQRREEHSGTWCESSGC